MRLPLLPLLVSRIPAGLRQALEQEGVPFQNRRRSGRAARFVLFDSRCEAMGSLAPGQHAIDIDMLREPGGFDPFEALVDERSMEANWPISRWQVSEEIARVDKRAVRHRIMTRLRNEVEQAGGVWLRVAPYPFPYRSALNFRIDYDEFSALDFDATLAAISGYEDATSHFVCGSNYQDQGEALARLRGLDVGSHGYWHHTYHDAEDNLENIRRGIEVLRRAGIEPSGFVAPHGRFNRGLSSVLEQLEISHSSEFALAYDDLPFFPADGNVVQIPVHPISLGIILEAARENSATTDDNAPRLKRAVEAAVDHFVSVAKEKYRAGEPIFLYGHPTHRLGRFPQVLRTVLETTDDFSALWKTTFSEMARWWRQRKQLSLSVYRLGDAYAVTAKGLPEGYRAAVEFSQGDRVAMLPLEGDVTRFSPGALRYQRRSVYRSFAQPTYVSRPVSIRSALLRTLDWEKVTPAREIRVHSWQGFVKKTLRYIKG